MGKIQWKCQDIKDEINFYFKDEGYKGYRKRIKTLKQLSSKNDPKAQYTLAIEYWMGSGYMEPNIKEAIGLFKKAYENGIQEAKDFIIDKDNYKEFYDKAIVEEKDALAKHIYDEYIQKEKLPF